MNSYKVYFTDGFSIIVRAMNEDEARWKAKNERPGCTISSVSYTV
jgi:hypothetical protein